MQENRQMYSDIKDELLLTRKQIAERVMKA